MSVSEINQLLAPQSESLPVHDVKNALAAAVTGYYFSVQSAISGPWALVALTVNGDMVIEEPIATSDHIISVNITAKVAEVGVPFTIRWVVLYGQGQPQSVAYLVDGNTHKKLAEKRNAKGGSLGVSKPHTYPPQGGGS